MSRFPGKPAHFVLIDWSASRVIGIRDFLFAPYVLEALEWARLGWRMVVGLWPGPLRHLRRPGLGAGAPSARRA